MEVKRVEGASIGRVEHQDVAFHCPAMLVRIGGDIEFAAGEETDRWKERDVLGRGAAELPSLSHDREIDLR